MIVTLVMQIGWVRTFKGWKCATSLCSSANYNFNHAIGSHTILCSMQGSFRCGDCVGESRDLAPIKVLFIAPLRFALVWSLTTLVQLRHRSCPFVASENKKCFWSHQNIFQQQVLCSSQCQFTVPPKQFISCLHTTLAFKLILIRIEKYAALSVNMSPLSI